MRAGASLAVATVRHGVRFDAAINVSARSFARRLRRNPFMRLLVSTAVAAVLSLTGATVGAPSPVQAQVSIGISVNFAPPPLPIYDQPPIPGPDYLWVPGYWAWDDDDYDYYWVPGTWVLAPEPGYLWTPAWWGWSEGVYAFHEGYWGPQIGFYGGIAYGFGYDGSGYQGGEWRGGHFFYNRTVNNITNVNITNVYNRSVTINRAATASFNGPGGVSASPTPQQQAAARQPHISPTPVQVRNVKAAAAMPALHAAANHGAPPVAATARPASFSGAGVVKAARPGGSYSPPAAAVQRQAQARAAHGQAAPAGAPAGAPRAGQAAAPPRAAAPTAARSTPRPTEAPPPRAAPERAAPERPAPPERAAPEARPTPPPGVAERAAPLRERPEAEPRAPAAAPPMREAAPARQAAPPRPPAAQPHPAPRPRPEEGQPPARQPSKPPPEEKKSEPPQP